MMKQGKCVALFVAGAALGMALAEAGACMMVPQYRRAMARKGRQAIRSVRIMCGDML